MSRSKCSFVFGFNDELNKREDSNETDQDHAPRTCSDAIVRKTLIWTPRCRENGANRQSSDSVLKHSSVFSKQTAGFNYAWDKVELRSFVEKCRLKKAIPRLPGCIKSPIETRSITALRRRLAGSRISVPCKRGNANTRGFPIRDVDFGNWRCLLLTDCSEAQAASLTDPRLELYEVHHIIYYLWGECKARRLWSSSPQSNKSSDREKAECVQSHQTGLQREHSASFRTRWVAYDLQCFN